MMSNETKAGSKEEKKKVDYRKQKKMDKKVTLN